MMLDFSGLRIIYEENGLKQEARKREKRKS